MNRVLKMSHDEQVKMYMKFTKAKIIDMLIECNRLPTYGQGIDEGLREGGSMKLTFEGISEETGEFLFDIFKKLCKKKETK